MCYDLKYALRLCSENGKDQATVQIYCTMNLYEEAVDLALKVDLEQAKLYADKPEYDEVLKKKLWLKVARHVVEQEQDVGKYVCLVSCMKIASCREKVLLVFYCFVPFPFTAYYFYNYQRGRKVFIRCCVESFVLSVKK